jgi:protein-S-isoprenylcysteine O-methyltransferase Ste14
MKITGVGPRIAIPSIIYLLITIIVDRLYYPIFKITLGSHATLIIIGVILILIGIGLVIICARKLVKSFNSNLLMTDGLYKVCRNPLYAIYLILVFPGLSLILNSWLVLTSVIMNFILLQAFIKAEYLYLEEKFGEEYKTYLNKVWIKFL